MILVTSHPTDLSDCFNSRLWWGISWQSVASPTETTVAAEAFGVFRAEVEVGFGAQNLLR